MNYNKLQGGKKKKKKKKKKNQFVYICTINISVLDNASKL